MKQVWKLKNKIIVRYINILKATEISNNKNKSIA